MPLKERGELNCILKNDSGQELLRFKAEPASELLINAGYEGGGVASGGQSFTIITEKTYPYEDYRHTVVVEGQTFRLSAHRISFRKHLGAMGKTRKVYILELE